MKPMASSKRIPENSKRKPKDLQKFEELRKLTVFLGLLFTQPMVEEICFEVYFQICYKFEFINSPNVNDTFEQDYPQYRNAILI